MTNKPWSEQPINAAAAGTSARDGRDLVEELESRRLMSASGDVALIDTSLPNFRDLAAAAETRDNVILYDGRRESAAKVLGKLAKWAASTRQQIHNISILSHGKAGSFQLGKDWITSEAVQKKAWQKLKDVLADDASIYLFGCNVAANAKGQTLLNHLATLSGADVYGSSDLTGGARKGGDWVLEASSANAPKAKSSAAAPLPSAKLASWDFTLAAGITVTPTTPTTTSEVGGTASFDVVLDEMPSDDVIIPIASTNTAEGTVSAASLTFTAANWNTPQTVTVTGQNDAIDDGDVNYTADVGPATSTDTNYNGLDAADVSMTNTDDDTAGITVTPTSGLVTTEVGGTATFDVSLNSQPTGDVTITLVNGDATEGSLSTTTLVFTAANWNTPQTVTITGQNDAMDDGDIAYTITTNAATSSDTNYNGLNAANVSVTNTDNDTAGITVNPTSGLTTTEAGGTAQFTVVLTSQPTADVTIGISSSNTAEGTVSASSLTFTAANWNVAQTVTITGQNEFIDDGNTGYTITTAAGTSADSTYNGMNASDVSVTNTDNDTAGVTVTPTSGLTTTEAGGQAQFTVVLTSQPTANVVINLSSSDTAEGTVSAGSVTFTPGNWSVAQQITITGQNEFVDDGDKSYSIVTAAATSGDANYSGMNASDVSVTNVDNDTAGINVTAISGPTTEAGGTATFSITLNSRPLNQVVIGISTGDATEGTVSTSSVTISPGQWNNPQTITVTGVNDLIDDGDVVYSIVTAAATSSDALYNGMNGADVSVTNTDNDTAGITVGAVSGNTTEAGGTANFTVVLNTQPVNDVVIGISSNDLTEGTVSTSFLTFTSANWNVAQTVTITGVDDLYDDGNVSYGIVTAAATSGDAPYNGLNANDVSLSNTDNDTSGFTITPTSGLTTTEAGGTATFTVRLNTIPFADVTLGLSSNDLTEGTVAPASLTFTAANWNVDQTVTVTGVNDFLVDGSVAYSIVTAAATSSDTNYNGLNPTNVSVTTTDNDVAGVTVTPTSGLNTTEGAGQATFDVVLNAQPTANVTIAIASSNTGEGTVSTSLLTFTPGNWNVAQQVTVTGVNDNVDDDNINYTITTGATSSSDATFNGLAVADVSVTNVDNDTAGITVNPTSGLVTTEANGQASFNVVLDTQPTANVVVNLSTTDATEGTIITTSLTFTPANWNTPQSVTVTGANDFLDDGDIAYSITTAAAVSSDAKYNGINPADVSLTNTDNDAAGVTVTPTSGLSTTEAGGTANFGVVLTSQPTADVTIAINSSNTAEGTVSTSLLTFTAANWNVTQTVTVTGVNDFVDDGDIAYTVVTGAAASADSGYNGMNASDVSVSNVDNDTAGFTITPTSGLSTTEAGGQASFTVRLTSQPTSDVSIGISSSDTTEGLVNTTLLTFTSANWNVDQTVTITGVDDLMADGNVGYSIVTAPATSSDANYNNLNPSDVSISNTDNDAAGITVTPTSGLVTTEAGATAQFTVVLTSQPTADVIVNLSSSDLTEGTLSTSSLTFNAANWNVPQAVTVTGVDDFVDDGNISYSVVTAAATSADSGYNGLNAADVTVSNTDDDTAGVTVSPTVGLTTTEAGSAVTFDVVLNSQPTSNVTIGIVTGDATEGTVSVSSVTFTPADWNVPQTVSVSSVDDALVDGSVTYSVVTNAATSSDATYNGINPSNVSVTNQDNDPNSTPLGTEGRVNTTTGNDQQTFSESPKAVATDANGNYVVTWSSMGQDGGSWGTYAQRFNYAGVAQGSEFRVNTATSNEQQYARVAMTPTGEFVITWSSNLQDGSGWGVYAQRYSAAGVAQGSEFRVAQTTASDQKFSDVAMDAAGNFIIAWTASGQDGSGTAIYARRYDSTGTAQGNEFRVNTTTAGDQTQPSVAMTQAGAFIVTWTSADADDDGVFAQRYNSSGATVGSQFRVNTETTKSQRDATVAYDANGNFVVAWSSLHQDGNGNFWGVFAQRFNNSGVAIGSEFKVNSSVARDQQFPSVAVDADGDFVVTWSGSNRDGSGWGVFAQQFQSDGTARGGEFRVNTTTSNDQRFSSVAMDETGDYVIVWTSTNQDGSQNGVYQQRYQGGNDAPVIAVPSAQTVNEDVTLTFSTGNGNRISVSDVDINSGLFQVTLSVTNGLLTLGQTTGLTFSTGDGTSDATMVFTGTAVDVNAALDGLSFAPTANYNGSATLSIGTSDLGNTGWDGPQTDSDSVAITVNAVNDAPVNTVPSAQTMSEDGVLTFSTGNGNRISVADIDAGSGNLRVTLTATNGTLTLASLTGLSFTTGDGLNDATMTFTGTAAALNTALDGLIYAPTANYNGAASVQITTNDLGNTGSGGALSDTDAVAVTVNAVNDAPVNTVPPAQSTNEDTSLVFSTANGNLVSINDLDAGSSSVRVTLTVTNGLLTLAGTTGLSFTSGDGVGDSSMTFTGTVTDINAALDGMTFAPTANYNGAASLQITTNDQGNTGSGGALADTDTVAITVNAINDAPVNTVPPAQVTNEDTPLVFSTGNGNLVSIADVDANGNDVPVTLTVTNGLLTLAGTTGLSFTVGDGTSDTTMTFTGTVAAINAALDGMSYSPTANYNGAASLQITTNDQGNTGSGGALADTDAVAITVNAVNDAPVNTVPGAVQVIDEDNSLVFSTGIGNRISIADLDAGSGSVRVTLVASNGTLTLNGTTGLSFITGDGVADSTLVFTGTVADVNAALDGMTFAPTANFNGAASVQITTNDLGNSGAGGALSDTDAVSITVNSINDGPTITAPATDATDEDTPRIFNAANGNAVAIVDPDAGNGIIRVVLTITNGTISLSGTSGLLFSVGDGSADTAMTFTGTLADVNAALDGLSYNPTANYNGAATLHVAVNDQGNSGSGGALASSHDVALTVNAVNDAPVNTVPGPQSVTEDNSLTFSSVNGNAITVSDLDLLAGTARVTLSATNGRLTLAQLTGLSFVTGDGVADTTMTFTGTIAAINAAMDGLVFAPNANFAGAAAVTITTNDQGNTGLGGAQADTDVVNVTVNAVNDAPVVTVPGAQTVNEDTDLVFAAIDGNGISVADVDSAAGLLQVTLVATNGTLTLASLAGLSFTTGDGTGDATMVFTGTVASINAALDGMTFRGAANFNGSANVAISVDDQGNTGAGGSLGDAGSVPITVGAINDAPVNNVPGPQNTDEDTPLVFSSVNGNAISISDVDAAGNLLRVTLSSNNGRLTLAQLTGLSFSTGDGVSDGTMTFTGTLTAINAALDGLGFAPNGNYNGPETITITTSDLGHNGVGGALVDTDTVDITIDPVNDPPVAIVPGAQTTVEDTDLVFNAGNGNLITIADVDAGSQQVILTLTASNGTLTLADLSGLTFIAGDGAFDATMTFRGKLNEINAALNGLIFTPNANFNGAAQIDVTADDQGHSGSGGSLAETKSVPITVTAVNDAPVNNVPTPQVVQEDGVLVFSTANGNLISISDVDVANGLLRVRLHASNGRITLAQLTGLAFSGGDGVNDTTMTFSGTLGDINAALDGLSLTLNANYNGPTTLHIRTDDLGNNGAGGAQTDDDDVTVTVDAVNDAPVNNLPATPQSVNEDGVLTLGGSNRISISDLDVTSGQQVQVTLTAANGTITLAQLIGLTFTTGDGTADAVMTFTGLLADVNAALNGLTFAPTANYNGAASIQIATSDLGNTGTGGAQVDVDTLNITVNAVNDAPVNTLPPAQSTNEDTPLVFSTANGNRISVNDVDAATLRVTLTAANGTITLAQLAGLTFITGDGTGDATMTFTGTLADINAALDGLAFNPNANFNGAASLQLTSNDLGATGSGGTRTDSDAVSITVNAVNDAPVNTVPPDQSVDEDDVLVFSSANGNRITIADLDANGESVRVTLTATNGLLTLGRTTGLNFSPGGGDGVDDATMTFTGSVAEINAALQGLIFRPFADFAGNAQIQIVTNDRGNNGLGGAQSDTDTVDIFVEPVNDAPVVVASPDVLVYTENDAPTAVDDGLVILDVDDNTMAGATVAIVGYVSGEDVLAFVDQAGITGSWDASTGVLTLTGVASVADYQTALRSITYANTSDNPATTSRTIEFVVGDGKAHNTPAAGRQLQVVAVNDGPVGGPLVITLNEDAGRSTQDLWQLFSDVDDAPGDVKFSIVGSANGAFFSSATIDPATGRLVLDSAADANGETIFTLRAEDAAGQSVETTLEVKVNPVNDAPVVATSDDVLPFDNDNPSLAIDADLAITDIDSPTLAGATVRIIDHVTGRDVLEFENQHGITGVFDAGTGVLTLSGVATVAEYEAALRSVQYTGVGVNTSGRSLQIQFAVTDGASATSAASSRSIKFPASGGVQPPIDTIPDEPAPDPEPPVSDPLPPAPPTSPKPPLRPIVDVVMPPRTAETTKKTPPPVPTPLPPPPIPPVVEAPAPQPQPEVIVVAPPPVPTPLPIAPPPPPVVVAKPPAIQTEKLWQQLDQIAQQLDAQHNKPKLNIGSVAGMTTTLFSVGYVIWCLRGGALVATLLTTLPLWRWLDPLPVLDEREREDEGKKKQNDDDEERIRTMMD